MCNRCNQPDYACSCGCDTCVDTCPIKLDFACILYNKEGKDASTLDGLNLPNGSTLKLVIELLDEKVKQLSVLNYTLPNLREDYTITNLQQFAEAVDTKFDLLDDTVADLTALNNTSLVANDSSTIDFSTSGNLNHTLTGSVKIGAPESSNCLIAQSDGLVAVPQTLSINYATKDLTISKGNSVNLASLVSSAFLGSVTSDPSGAINGNYWYNTNQSKLKIKVNNLVKEILTA